MFCRILLVVMATQGASGAGYRAGVARVDITPVGPIWLSGYASRTHPSDGVLTPLFAKALAVEDGKGGRVVFVTTDLIGLPRVVSDVVSARALKEFGLERSQLVLNSSHTHTGPIVKPGLISMFDLTPEDDMVLRDYALTLTGNLVTVIGAALGSMAPARLSYGEGEASFVVNRRDAKGPVDHTVPVLKVAAVDGALRAALFGYACHNTTLTGSFYQLSGDYAAYAQAELESRHLGMTALFGMLCGGDQNPAPRGSVELARTHGRALADSVDRVLTGKLAPIEGDIRTAFLTTEIALAPHTREMFEKLKDDPVPAKRNMAAAMLRGYDERHPVRSVVYPVQAVRFGKSVVFLALGGEVVVDYCLRARLEYPKRKLVVMGYSNDVMSYIPSRRVLAEGGYEAVDSMPYYGLPGPFTSEVEDTVFDAIHRVMKRIGL